MQNEHEHDKHELEHDDVRELWRASETASAEQPAGEQHEEQPPPTVEAQASEVCICDLSVADENGNFPPCAE